MKKKLLLIVITLVCVLNLFGCGCKHEWLEATCTAPKTCSLCNKVEGEVADHKWQDATCVSPKICSTCNETEGESVTFMLTKAE